MISETLRARPGTVRVRYGPPLSTTGLTEDDARALADRAQAMVTEMYAALGKPEATAAPAAAE